MHRRRDHNDNGTRINRGENINEEQRDACLIDIKIKVAKMSTDIAWLKRLLVAAGIMAAAILGINLPDIFIQG